MPSINNDTSKKMNIKINGTVIANISANGVYNYKKLEYLVSLTAGTIQLSMQMYGTTPDSMGMIAAGVYLQRLVPTIDTSNSNN